MTILTPDQISNLTRKAEQAESHKSRWLTSKDAARLLDAMDDDATELVIGGQVFSLKYDAKGNVFVKPKTVGVYAPCGWYSPSLLRSIAI